MKKIIFLTITLLISVFGQSQNQNSENKKVPKKAESKGEFQPCCFQCDSCKIISENPCKCPRCGREMRKMQLKKLDKKKNDVGDVNNRVAIDYCYSSLTKPGEFRRNQQWEVSDKK